MRKCDIPMGDLGARRFKTTHFRILKQIGELLSEHQDPLQVPSVVAQLAEVLDLHK